MKAKWSHRYRVIRTGIFVLTVIEGHKQLPADLDLDELEP